MKIEHELKELSDAAQSDLSIIEDENYYNVKTSLVGAMDNDLGARELGRIINNEIISKLINHIIEMELDEKTVFYFDTEKKLHVWEDAKK